MQAVLYVAHGSRVKKGIEEAVQFIETVKPDIDAEIQEICFLELAEPSILQGIERCVLKGATSIAVIPILLLTANHAKYDIPKEVEKGSKKYPSISFTIGKPFGVHKKLIQSLHERVIEKSDTTCDQIEVLLIGRGSSDIRVQKDLGEIADLLKKTYNYAKVDTCFLYGKGPSFEEKLQTFNEVSNPVYIVPYLLFTGLLKFGIQKKLEEQSFLLNQVVLCECLGYDENVRQVMIERVKESLYSLAGRGWNG